MGLDGRIDDDTQRKLKHAAFSGGIHPTVRREMWKVIILLLLLRFVTSLVSFGILFVGFHV